MKKFTGIALTLVGIILLVSGLIDKELVDEFHVYYLACGTAIVMGVLMMAGEKGQVTALYLARIVTGAVFVVSGLIKANDTVGFSIKLQEYFDPNSLGSFWAAFHDYSLPIAILLTGVEVVLGLSLLFGLRSRLTTLLLLAMTLFFGWLTWFTAHCNDAQLAAMTAGQDFKDVCVTDCGCFGDALRGTLGRSFTPWESFYKDLQLFFMVIVLVVQSKKIHLNQLREDLIVLPGAAIVILLFSGWLFDWMFPFYFLMGCTVIYVLLKAITLPLAPKEWVIAGTMFILSYGFATYTLRHLPIKDYRPFAVGKNIPNEMKTAEELGKKPTVYANIYFLKNTKTGKEKTMNSVDYLNQKMWQDTSWQIAHTGDHPIVLERGYEPPIASFNILDSSGNDIGNQLISDPNYEIWVVSFDITKANRSHQKKINELAEKAENDGMKVLGLTASGSDVVSGFKEKYHINYPFYTGDEVLLKTIIRSNPGLVLVKNGTIVAKWHHNDIPNFSEIEQKYLK